MKTRPLIVVMVALLWSAGANADAQTTPCTAAPGKPRDVVIDLETAVKNPLPDTRSLPAVLVIGWSAPASDRRRPENDATGYVVEAGTARALADVAAVDTDGPDLQYRAPVANGTYYVRLRARNACGTGAPSADAEVRVTGSVPQGTPGPLVLLPSVNAVRERLGGTAFIRVTGQVRNAWRAGTASFVQVKAIFDGPAGEVGQTASTYVAARSRRLTRSGLVTDTVLDAADTGCFILFAAFPAYEVTGVRFEVTADADRTEVLKSDVGQVGPAEQRADDFGQLVVSGRAVNKGPARTRFTQVWVEARNAEGQVLDCDAAPVVGTPIEARGSVTRTGLLAGAGGDYRIATDAVFADGVRVREWVTWDEDGGTEVTSERYDALRTQLGELLESDDPTLSPQERAALRTSLRDETRTIERGQAAAPR